MDAKVNLVNSIGNVIPKRDAVIAEMIDGRFVIHIEAKTLETRKALETAARLILKTLNPAG